MEGRSGHAARGLALLAALCMGVGGCTPSLGLAPPPTPPPARLSDDQLIEAWIDALALGELEPLVQALAPEARARIARGFTDPATTLFLLERSPEGRALRATPRWKPGAIHVLGRVGEGALEHVIVIADGNPREPIVVTLVNVDGQRALELPRGFTEAGPLSSEPPAQAAPLEGPPAQAWAAWSRYQEALVVGDVPTAAALLHPEGLELVKATMCEPGRLQALLEASLEGRSPEMQAMSAEVQRLAQETPWDSVDEVLAAQLRGRCALPADELGASLMSEVFVLLRQEHGLIETHQPLGAARFIDGWLLLSRSRAQLDSGYPVRVPLQLTWMRPHEGEWRVVLEQPKDRFATFTSEVVAQGRQPFPILDPPPLDCEGKEGLILDTFVGREVTTVACETSVRDYAREHPLELGRRLGFWLAKGRLMKAISKGNRLLRATLGAARLRVLLDDALALGGEAGREHLIASLEAIVELEVLPELDAALEQDIQQWLEEALLPQRLEAGAYAEPRR
ncbi:MAG: hypothetical protein H6740_14240 [Alphaproteobacteria bacterium]|nr:hypothetical protein [Alphaproteobacteria bacterium]